MNKAPQVSIVIPTHRGSETQTADLVASIKRSTFKDFEIIVVDEGLERSAQRNIGLKRAKGEFIFIPDSDWVITPGLLQECVDYMADGYDAVYIPEVIATKGWFARVRNFERQFYTATPIDVVRFVRLSCCPFFDEGMTGPEDSDWDRRVKGRRITSKNVYYHHDNVGFFKYFQKKAFYSTSMRRFEEKNRGDLVLDLKYRCWVVFVERGKWVQLVLHPIMTLGILLNVVLRGVIYLAVR